MANGKVKNDIISEYEEVFKSIEKNGNKQ